MSKFSFETIENFDDHISSSILGYDILHSLIVNISSFYIKRGTVPIDLGCTSGKLLQKINSTYNCNSIGYDITDAQFIKGLDLRKQDITDAKFKLPKSNIIYCIFTLQFIQFSKRLALLKKVYSSLDNNGVFIFCEKETCLDGQFQEVFIFSNYQYKQMRFTPDEILKKEKDLRDIMNCVTSSVNVKLLNSAGFSIVEPFFQSLNFKGYLCKK